MLRIVILTGHFRPAVGGTEAQTHHLAREWTTRGHRVEIWTRRLDPSHQPIEDDGGATIRRLGFSRGVRTGPGSWIEKLSFLMSLTENLVRRRRDYDIVIVQQALHPAIAAALAGLLTKRPLVVRNASSGLTSDLAALRRPWGAMLALLQRRAKRLIVLTEVGKTEAIQAGFADPQVELISNGVEPGAAPPPRPARDEPVVLYVGGLRREKNVALLLDAWRMAAVPGVLIIAGDGPERARLETSAAHMGVRFVGNIDAPRALMREADVFVLSSDAEGMSNALLEAMAEGCACLATSVGGNIDCLSPGSATPDSGGIVKGPAGWLVRSRDTAAMAQALRELCLDPVARKTISRGARQKVLSDHSLQASASRYLEVFATVIREASSRPRPKAGAFSAK